MTDSYLQQLRNQKLHGISPLQLKKEKLTPLNELLKDAEREVNQFIRNRDKKLGCITCGDKVTDAGHFIPVGENSALRFEELNIWGQCINCNRHKDGNRKVYRIELIKRIGLESFTNGAVNN